MNQARREALTIGVNHQAELLNRPPMIHAVDHWVPEKIAGALGIAKELGLDAYSGKVDEIWPYPTLVVFPPKKGDLGDLGDFWEKLQEEFPLNP